MPNCFSSTFICLHHVLDSGRSWKGKKKSKNAQRWRKVEGQDKLKVLFVFIIHIVTLAKCHVCIFFFSLPLHFPLRWVIQLHYLDVLLKSIMDSWGFPCFSSSFTEYSQCYSNIPTTLSCIGNEPSAPTSPPTQQPPWDHPPLHIDTR